MTALPLNYSGLDLQIADWCFDAAERWRLAHTRRVARACYRRIFVPGHGQD